jgi:hypothetical protein
MTDFRALCAELADAARVVREYVSEPCSTYDLDEALAAADAALAQPEPQASKPAPDYGRVPEIATEAQIRSAAQYLVKKQGCDGDLVPAIRYAIARWGRPAIEPVPVAERLPVPQDCNGKGYFWAYAGDNWEETDINGMNWQHLHHHGYTHWLPYHALPVPHA